jgi:hemoglobin/transferrin/lactoferrin receptor protein
MFRLTILCLIGYLGFIQIALAQDIDSLALPMQELLVSADRFEEKRKDLPRQIDLITRKNILHLNKQNTADLLFETGNVYIQKSQQGGGSPILRGFEANKVLLVLDGIRLNNAIYRGGHLQNVLRIEQQMLEKVEVLYGPGSLMYGSDALGGVVHFTSLKPSLDKPIQVAVTSRMSSVNAEQTQSLTTQAAYKNWGVLFHYSQSKFDDLVQGKNRSTAMGDLGLRQVFQQRVGDSDRVVQNPNPHKQIGSAYQQQNLMTKIRFQPKVYAEHLLSYYYSTTGNVQRYDRLSELENKLPRFGDWYYGPEKMHFLNYQFSTHLVRKSWDQMRVIAALQQVNESRNTRNFGNPWLNQRKEKVWVGSINIDMRKKWKIHEIRYGLEYAYNQIESKAIATHLITTQQRNISTRYPDGGSHTHAFGAYLHVSQEFNQRWVLTEGIRLNYNTLQSNFSDKSFFSFLPNQIKQRYAPVSANIGLVFMANKQLRIYGNVGNAFRVPNVDDIGKIFDSRPGSIMIVPNQNLKPEQAITQEIGLDARIRKNWQIEANLYYTHVWNALFTKSNGLDSQEFDGIITPVFSTQNAQEARILGYHLGLKYQLHKTVKIIGSLNKSMGKILGDSLMPLDHIPPMFGRVEILYQKKQWQISLNSILSAAKPLSQYYLLGEDNIQYATENGLPGWATINVRGSYRLLKNNALGLNAGIDNILDRNYRTFASGISGAGRNFWFSLSYDFN